MILRAPAACWAWVILCGGVLAAEGPAEAPPGPAWEQIRPFAMQGDWKVFWNVGGGDKEFNNRAAQTHGFRLLNLLNTYADYPGKQKENIDHFLDDNRSNPWNKPEFFERIIRRNIAAASGPGELFVHDIEFAFEEDLEKAWADPAARAASGAASRAEFAERYWREWASWFSAPCRWAKEQYPHKPVGVYGPQPFRRDYWGVAGKSAAQIDGTHRNDAELWRYIDPAVDFTIASVYVFYDDPGSVYYMAANIEENFQRMRQYGGKPLYAYEWLRYHNSNKKLAGQELKPYLVEAMAALPFFSGARGLALWGWEPKRKGQYYQTLPLFCESLGRVANISALAAKAEVVIDEPAHVLWKEKRPLVRKLKVSAAEWFVMAIDPWQADDQSRTISVRCGAQSVPVALAGKHTQIVHVRGDRVEGR